MGSVAWNPRTVSAPEPHVSPPQPDVQTTSTHSYPAQSAGTTNTVTTAAAPEPKLVQFTPISSPTNEGDRPSYTPRSFADDSQPKSHSYAGLEGDDARRGLIDQGYWIQEIDREANALADQTIDVDGARDDVKTAAGNEQAFWQGVYSKLSSKQNKELQSLAKDIETAPDKAAAQAKFDTKLTPLLSAEQRTQLQTLQRQTQDAQIELNGQVIGQRLRDAQSNGNAEQLSLATADARAHISDKHQLAANRKLEDAYALVMTPENQKSFSASQQAVVDAVQKLSLNPGDPTAQQGVKDAKQALDDAQGKVLSAEDKKIIDTLEAAQERERDLGSLLVQEAQTEHRYVELKEVGAQRSLNDTEKRILDLAKRDFDVVQKNREVRDLAVQAANAEEGDREAILNDLSTKLSEFMRAKSDADIKRAEFAKDVAQNGNVPAGGTQDTSAGNVQTVAYTQTTSGTKRAQTAAVGKEFAMDLPSTDLTLDQASKNLDAVKQQRDELEEMLKPPPAPKKSGWDRALDIIAGVGEIIGGVAVAAFAGWTGIGAVAGGAIAVDGFLRLGHSISDAAHGTTTDTWQSQGFQALGASRDTANRIDTGLNLVATVPVGVGGAAMGAFKASTMLMKSVNVAGGVTVLDGAQAGARYVATGDHAKSFMVDGLMKAGLSETQANYALMGGNLIATGGAVAAARGRAPTTGAAQVTDTTGSASENTGASSGSTNNVSSNTQPVNASGLDPTANPWGPEGKGGRGVTLLRDDGSIDSRTDVAILGSSHVALTLGADLVLNQPGVRLKILIRPKGPDRIAELAHPYDFQETLHTHVSQFMELSPDLFSYAPSAEAARALQQAKTIVVTIPDKPQVRMELFNKLQDDGLVQDPAKTIVLIRGGQAGQPVLSQMIRDNPNWKANMVLVEDSPYGTRVGQEIGENGLPTIRAKRKDNVEITVLGHQGDSSIASGAMREMFPLNRGDNPWPRFDLVPGMDMPFRAGYFIHPGVAFDRVNLAKTARGEVYYHYAQGVHPELGVKLGNIDRERVEIAARYGVEADTFPQKLYRQFGLELRDEPFHVTMARTGPKELGGEKIYLSKSYESMEKLMDSRYPTEDVPGLFTINWLAERAGGRTPAHIAYETEIRQTLRELGISEHQMRHELGAYLPYLDAIEGGIPEITRLLNEPHVRPNA